MAQRFLPVVQVLGRGLISSRTELFQQGAKAYNSQNFTTFNNSSPCAIYTPLDWQNYSQNLGLNHDNVNKQLGKNLSTSCLSILNDFKDTENEYAHQVLQSLPAYQETTTSNRNIDHFDYVNFLPENDKIAFLRKDWSTASIEDLTNAFINLSHLSMYQSINLENHSSLFNFLGKILCNLSDDYLLKMLKCLSLWPPILATTSQSFIVLSNALDFECTKRMNHWNIDQLFLVADHWYALRLSKMSKFNNEMMKTLGRHIKTMSPSHLVQYLFYANLGRQLAPFIIMKDLEKQLVKAIEYISIDELGVIAMGFFKTQTYPKNMALLESIIEKTKLNLHCVSDPSLGAILKLLRRAMPVSHWKEIQSLMDLLVPHIDHLNTMCLLQIALLGNDLLIFHPNIINKISSRFVQSITDIRLKDLERWTFVLMLYNYIPPNIPNILEIISNELRQTHRKNEIYQYPRCFISSIVYLVAIGHMPYDLIDEALHPKILNQLKTSKNYSDIDREINELDWAIEIESPQNYKGNRIDPSTRRSLTKKYMGHLPSEHDKQTHQDRLLLEVKDKLSVILGGDEYVGISFILPHNQNPDLVFCTSKSGEPLPIPDDFLKKPADSLKTIDAFDPNLEWNVVIVGGRNCCIRNTDLLRGTVQMKKRQMASLGYNVAVVPFMKFSKKSLISKLKCLEEILEANTTLRTFGRIESSYAILQSKKSK